MNINCIAVNITKSAGIRAEIADISPSPAVIFITRDHHYNDDYFSQIKEGDRFSATVIGQRFELNDKFISIIAKLIEPSSQKKNDTKPTVIFEDEIPVPALKSKSKVSSIKSKVEVPSIKAKFVLDEEEEEPEEEYQQEEEEDEIIIPKNVITNHH
jgi:hypothetical protein